MAKPKSRRLIMEGLARWIRATSAKDLGIRGKMELVWYEPGKTHLIIRVQDDQEREVIDYKISIYEMPA